MRKLRYLRWLCSLSLVASLLSGVAFGVEIPNLDDLGIDPWGDYNNLPSILPTVTPAPSSAPEECEGEGLYSLDSDTGIMPSSVDIGTDKFSIRWGGFSAYGSDIDDLSWEGIPVLETSSAIRGPSPGPINWSEVTGFGNLYTSPLRSPTVNSQVASSNKPWYVGRHPIYNEDPEITNRTTVNFRGGYVFFDLPMDGPVDSARSFQILNARFNFGIRYGGWNSSTDSSDWPSYDLGTKVDFATLSEVHVLVNGKDLGPIDYSATPYTVINRARLYDIKIDNAVVGFDEQRVSSVSIAFVFNPSSWTAGNSRKIHCSGGWAVTVVQPRSSDGTYLSYYQPGGEYILSSDSAAENTGLLKSVLQFLQNIVNGITNVAQQIARLPGLIADAIMGGLRSLFIPTEQDLTQLKADYQSMLETKFGFIYQCFQLLDNFFTTLVDGWGSASDYTFNFPGVSFEIQGVTYTLIAPQPISLDNALMDVLRPVAGTIVSFICVLAFVHSMETMFIAIISGKNYFDYVNSAYGMTANEGLSEEDENV